ncbi:hypothetical protein B0H13DRAFT_2402435 [Mycena leptocephala]|nr:hypothetical protein B0H13DRAFT_2402435 [Mycena leptocephala]
MKTTSNALLTEALTLDYNNTIPIPSVHSVFKGSREYLNLVMDYVEGTELEATWEDMQPVDRLAVMNQLRRLRPPRPGAVEAVDGTSCKDFRARPEPFGPFNSVVEFQKFLGRDWLIDNKFPEYDELTPTLQRCVSQTVFTHCELAPRNILMNGACIVAIVDWEMAGWYPRLGVYSGLLFQSSLPRGFWNLFEKEAFSEKYPDDLIIEASKFVCC